MGIFCIPRSCPIQPAHGAVPVAVYRILKAAVIEVHIDVGIVSHEPEALTCGLLPSLTSLHHRASLAKERQIVVHNPPVLYMLAKALSAINARTVRPADKLLTEDASGVRYAISICHGM